MVEEVAKSTLAGKDQKVDKTNLDFSCEIRVDAAGQPTSATVIFAGVTTELRDGDGTSFAALGADDGAATLGMDIKTFGVSVEARKDVRNSSRRQSRSRSPR